MNIFLHFSVINHRHQGHTKPAHPMCIYSKGKAVPVTGLEWPRGFQEVKVPRFHDNGTG